MEPLDAAAGTASAVSAIASHFMIDMGTYGKGSELGFGGVDFYVGGRAGVLGAVDADVVAAAFAFFEPGAVRTLWEQALAVMAPADVSVAFMACGYQWADEHLGDGVDWARLATLLRAVADGANPAVAPLFAGWRAVAEPAGLSDKALALHRFNLLRELRNALHAAAVVSTGLLPVEALMCKTPYMAQIFGWVGEVPTVGDEHQALHAVADEGTDRALAPAFGTLSAAERAELVDLCGAAMLAVQ